MRDSVPGLAYPSNRLLGAVLLFLILDLSVLLINLWIANEVACNAVAINLAGRQRMLSQQISKNLLLLTQTDPQQVPPGTRQELNQGLYLFQQTLSAFAEGSTATDTTLQPVALRAVEGEAALLVSRTRLLIQPLTRLLHSAHPGPTSDPSVLQPANRYMVEHNREILDLMNRLTWRLEEDARQRTRTLQIVQVCAFTLAIGNFAAIMICMLRRMRQAERQRREWQDAAYHDPLTGLLNRHGLETKARHLLADGHTQGTLLLLDLDGFKPVNDLHGHPTGDLVLKYVAQALRQVARNTDLLARMGGDEFVLICPRIDQADAVQHLCNRLLDAIARVSLPDHPIHLRVSIGAAFFPRQAAHLPELIRIADQAMYLSKRDGGQRWSLAPHAAPVAKPTAR